MESCEMAENKITIWGIHVKRVYVPDPEKPEE